MIAAVCVGSAFASAFQAYSAGEADGGMKHDRSHHCAGFRHTNECSGSFQYTGDKTDKPVGIGRMGAVHSASALYWGMVFYRKAGGHGTVPGNAQVCAAWRSDRSRDHHYCNPEHEQSGTGAVGDADCDCAADRRMADRTVRMVWNGEDQL